MFEYLVYKYDTMSGALKQPKTCVGSNNFKIITLNVSNKQTLNKIVNKSYVIIALFQRLENILIE